MKAFVDTSTLFKKYHQEIGSDNLSTWLMKLDEIYISPLTQIELHSCVNRFYEEKRATQNVVQIMLEEIVKDLPFFYLVNWNETLEDFSCQMIGKYNLRSFDSVQLAAATIAGTDFFLTSDKRLFKAAQIELKNAIFI